MKTKRKAAVSSTIGRLVRLIFGEADGPWPCEVCGASTFDIWVSPDISEMPTNTPRQHFARTATAIKRGTYRCRNHEPNNASLSIPGGEPGYAPGDCSVSLAEHQEEIGPLWEADPACWHELDKSCVDGVRCTKCGGWYCF